VQTTTLDERKSCGNMDRGMLRQKAEKKNCGEGQNKQANRKRRNATGNQGKVGGYEKKTWRERSDAAGENNPKRTNRKEKNSQERGV